jgi:bla regulator protein blaR1
MILEYLSAMSREIAPALGNHLCQSTLFAITAGLLTLVLRKNHARIRYWLWLATSVKFLIPFSLLVGMGSHLPWSRGSAGTKAGLYVAMEEVGQPFRPTLPVISRATPSTAFPSLVDLLPALLAAVWLCGFVVVLFVWYSRWQRISAAVREAAPLREGREMEALRRLERLVEVRKRIEMRLSRASLEPGIFGIARPVLVWPEGISERLGDAHLDAILAHEVWHVRRRDNLAAAIHMAVEATFWFHPLVWWLGARLVAERERACDEEVLESGSERQVYAESILKICEFCVGSPLACVSGVTGADLKKRIVYIMTKNVSRKLDFTRKLVLGGAGFVVFAVPIVFGLAKPMQSRAESPAQNTGVVTPGYESVSIKPAHPVGGIVSSRMMMMTDGFTATNATLQGVIQVAYGVKDNQISGGPDWLNSEMYDIEAKVDKSVADEVRKLSEDQGGLENQRKLQALLADRFKLSLHHETKELPVYELVIAKSGPKLQEARPGDTYPNGFKSPDGRGGAGMLQIGLRGGPLTGQGAPIESLAHFLSKELGRIVVDKTGLTGKYDFTLHWPTTVGAQQATASTSSPRSSGPSIFAAIQEQLGLKLEQQTVPMEVLVIDRVEKPSESQAQATAAITPAYETVSIKPNKTGEAMAPFKIVGKPVLAFSLKPGRFLATNATLPQLMRSVYDVQDDQISGGPNWLNSENYDVEVKMDKSVVDELQKLSPDQQFLEQKRMLQAVLADRFKMTLRRETRELPVYALVLAQNGPQLHEAKPGDTYPNGLKRQDGLAQGAGLWSPGKGQLVGQGVSLTRLVGQLSRQLGGRIVVDKTSLMSKYDFTLQWTPAESSQQGPDHTPSPESSGPSIFTALQEQLGLKLEPQTAPVEVLVIDHAEKPSEN